MRSFFATARTWVIALILAVCLLSVGIGLWFQRSDSVKEELPEIQTVGQLLQHYSWKDKFEPVLDDLRIRPDSVLSKELPVGLPPDGKEIDVPVDGNKFLRLTEDGILTKYGIMPSEVEKLPDRREGPLTREEFIDIAKTLIDSGAIGTRNKEISYKLVSSQSSSVG